MVRARAYSMEVYAVTDDVDILTVAAAIYERAVLDRNSTAQCADFLDHAVCDCAKIILDGVHVYVQEFPQSSAIEIAHEILRLSNAG